MLTVGDRRIQPALAQGRGPLCAPECSAASVGCRPGRSAPHAGQPLQSYLTRGSKVAGALALTKVFARVNHAAWRARGARKGRDKALLRVSGT
jgi:hypothetical protein